ncbi:hypothetical protein KSF_058800 [Reticulibacter mediterranei]|uniref:Uncharacterized protein n=1 Tax=Reticulibacter mediterranei TaxID=2778369 RepID=A0A8J3IS33_9CHLR|nr:hypothetical protein [Reticulibacter mediterranei]GHO95832.1 hypothetical protein KSF_058800 [Reticulibacter mediterranei]
MAYKLNEIKRPEKWIESLGQIFRKAIGLWGGSKGSISHQLLALESTTVAELQLAAMP